MMGRRRRGKAGQAIVEAALVTPIVMLLILGTYDVSVFASDRVQAVTAVRSGARTGALLGGKGGANQATCKGSIPSTYQPADGDADSVYDGDQDAVDAQIVQAVLRGVANMNYATIQEVDVYQPSSAGGQYTGGDLIDRYDPTGAEMKSGSPLKDTQTFDIGAHRCQGPLGGESELGVRVIWTYRPANRVAGSVFPNLTDWAVEKLAYCDPGCHQ
jgi:hypothetical protein